ncbi:ubiquinone anaerobic biosynthesis protein UbiV [Bradyrhizobium cenepequi]|uniref:ubiquinone anaerobic biosynthesis protein UbiV n=1 Tax=Bradyrhizobium cenepequi TaxID=2821403 RepID=UPI001CE2A4B2|nr:U32 family peptidase [Bradyrhizobium cenepequi]MCA6107114.1 U32 family peptidase [Bradyrhizobium cenepequi]
MQLSLGPVLYNWAPERWRDFYFRIADEAPVDTVAIGEIVCSKRSPFIAPHLPAVVERLRAAGKQVLPGSLILTSLPRERRQMADLVNTEELLVEVNDLTCLKPLIGRPHAIGPFINIYNEASAAFHAQRGATRICLPPELPMSSVAAIAAAVPNVLIDIFAFGRVPLAISARCYHARLHKLTKDNCQFVCERDPDGLMLRTLDGADFLTVNGVQTLSSTCTNLLGDANALSEAGVGSFRLSPQDCDMVAVISVFRAALDGREDAESGTRRLAQLYPNAPFSNGFLHGVAGFVSVAPDARSSRQHGFREPIEPHML